MSLPGNCRLLRHLPGECQQLVAICFSQRQPPQPRSKIVAGGENDLTPIRRPDGVVRHPVSKGQPFRFSLWCEVHGKGQRVHITDPCAATPNEHHSAPIRRKRWAVVGPGCAWRECDASPLASGHREQDQTEGLLVAYPLRDHQPLSVGRPRQPVESPAPTHPSADIPLCESAFRATQRRDQKHSGLPVAKAPLESDVTPIRGPRWPAVTGAIGGDAQRFSRPDQFPVDISVVRSGQTADSPVLGVRRGKALFPMRIPPGKCCSSR